MYTGLGKRTRLVINCLIIIEGLLKVTSSRVHCKRGDISETVQDRDIVTTHHQKRQLRDLE